MAAMTRAPESSRSTLAAGYGSTAKVLHWLIAAVVLTQFVISFLMPDVGPRTVPGTLINLHFSFGVTILLVMAIRFVHRLVHPVPLEMPTSPGWQRWTAHATHLLFYFILLIAPFLGWASASAHNLPVTVFGLFRLPDIAAPKARWALTAGDIHTYSMWTLLGLIAIHILVALHHHFIEHDGVLRRMLPAHR